MKCTSGDEPSVMWRCSLLYMFCSKGEESISEEYMDDMKQGEDTTHQCISEGFYCISRFCGMIVVVV